MTFVQVEKKKKKKVFNLLQIILVEMEVLGFEPFCIKRLEVLIPNKEGLQ
jgi:hypothetical protein